MHAKTIAYRSPPTVRRSAPGRRAATAGNVLLALGISFAILAVPLRYHASAFSGRDLTGLLFYAASWLCGGTAAICGRVAEARSWGGRGSVAVVLGIALVPVSMGLCIAFPAYGLGNIH